MSLTLTGKDTGGVWRRLHILQAHTAKPGWRHPSSRAGATEGLPIVAESGEVVGTATPSAQAPSPTPAPATAADDRDSAAAPGLDLGFSSGGVGSVFFYSNELSAPNGDSSDWVQFTPYYDSIRIGLACEGNGRLTSTGP